jgi:diacylglycerol kinase (ATP)
MPLRKWIKSANYAVEGILYAAKTQRHVRYHLIAASTVLILSFILGLNRMEFLFISFVTILVILAEMINSALEVTVDILSPHKSEMARIAKDIAAGAVMITAFGAAVVGYIVLVPYLIKAFHEGITIAKHTGEEIAVVAFIIVLITVIITKAHFGKGHPLRGGLPSGHAAISFSIWISATYISENYIISILTFIAAVLIAQSRVAVKVHNAWEVILGALIGVLLTFILFQVFY